MDLKNVDIRYKKDIEEAIVFLKSIGCTEIYLFGSIKDGTTHVNSDIDLAVKGILPERFFQIYGELMLRLSHPVDLIDLDLQHELGQFLLNSGELIRVA
jgi:predicted nucleotidyltransferase